MNTERHIRVLVVDNDDPNLDIIRTELSGKSIELSIARSGPEAIRVLEFRKVDVVILDTDIPEIGAFTFLRYIRGHFKDIEIIMTTRTPSVNDAVRAIKYGAENFLVKPLKGEELQRAVNLIAEKFSQRQALQSGSRPPAAYGLVGVSQSIRKVVERIERAAAINANVLIHGESGTGKELVARALHYNSSRKDKPFVPVNCGAIPEHLLESELFGHVRGAFTGAIKDKVGWFESANGGTIFLDEINDMSSALQIRLLRVLQTGEYSRVGSTKICHCGVRVVSASSKNLQRLIKTGDFREEVYYRLNVVDIELPPLRDRMEDIPLLSNFFLKEYAQKLGKNILAVSENVKSILSNYNFPGNVRELENIIHRALVLVEGDTIQIKHLPNSLQQGTTESDFPKELPNFQIAKQQAVENFERGFIIRCLKQTNGNITQAAKLCGMHVKNFFEKVKKSGIKPEFYKQKNR